MSKTAEGQPITGDVYQVDDDLEGNEELAAPVLSRKGFNNLLFPFMFGLVKVIEYLHAIETAKILLESTPAAIFETLQDYPSRGWLETRNPKRTEFFNTKDGHQKYLRYMCLNDPLLYTIMIRAYSDFFSESAPDGPAPTLGAVFQKHMGYAKEALSNEFPGVEPNLDNIVHVAIFTMAGMLGNISYEDVVNLGINPGIPDPSDTGIWLFPKNHKKLPREFPEDAAKCTSYID